MDTESLIQLKVTLQLAIEAISRHEKKIESNSLALAELTKSQALVDSFIDEHEKIDLKEMSFDVKALKDNLTSATQRMNGVSIALTVTFLTAIAGIVTAPFISQYTNAPSQIKNK
jgi:hypothetical protein